MTIQPIDAHRLCLTLTSADLSSYGVTPAALTQEQALGLTREACRRSGVILDGAVEIEVYPERWGALVFARSRALPRRPRHFSRPRRPGL